MKCRICNNIEENKSHTAKEMMFGMRDEFEYLECGSCGCLQICETPASISKYYPDNYYSLTPSEKSGLKHIISKKIKKLRDNAAIFNSGLIGPILNRFYPNEILKTLSGILPSKKLRVLDVGCGKGVILNQLKEIGFKNLSGIDPFIDNDIRYDNGLSIEKKSFEDADGVWDVIMFHHSFEHMPNPKQIFSLLNQKLTNNGTVIIRIPVADSFSWQEYGTNWVQLDAPRHFFLHTTKSMQLLADQTGLEIIDIIYDSTEFQFWGSEQYSRNISLNDEQSYKINPTSSIFSKQEMKAYKIKANLLNQQKTGDSSAFILRKKQSQ
jgi:2-polyprenyl-3-methyl-5-hydroxy-6-metoxy-1,4-benzoquinol methylase